MKAFFHGLFFFALLFQACESGDNNQNGLFIIAGSICGWCAGTDSVVITSEIITFEFANCDVKLSETKETEESEWSELKNSINLEEFKKINLNTCYVCADGCDYWVEIRSATFRHRIRYGQQDSSAVSKIQPFLRKVHSIRASFKTGE
ncbi:MAG TPA: hypothetical protein VHI78_06395 [Bacteroidales bacterium]|nr:hypothetical protein [Bacteroidales bacterium]